MSTATSSTSASAGLEKWKGVRILTSSLQDFRTEKFKLANGLRVYVISDPGTREAAAALTVASGSWKDIPGQEGIAHFTEHLTFLG